MGGGDTGDQVSLGMFCVGRLVFCPSQRKESADGTAVGIERRPWTAGPDFRCSTKVLETFLCDTEAGHTQSAPKPGRKVSVRQGSRFGQANEFAQCQPSFQDKQRSGLNTDVLPRWSY